ncbi:MAG: acyltransferase family protein [Clostridia bacterium]|nr:acyltransferase family protein [Clostridia bacterium]
MSQTEVRIQKSNNAIDLCKLIMAVFVIAIHTHPLENCKNQSVLAFYDMIVSMAVPFFFLSSGYFLGSKVRLVSEANEKTAHAFKYFCKIARMYVVWTIIYLPLAVYSALKNDKSVLHDIALYIRNFFFIGEQYNSWHLWYLLSTVYALILVMAMLRLKWSERRWTVVIGMMCMLSIALDTLAQYSGDLPAALAVVDKLVSLSIQNGRILQGAIYIPIGMLMAGRKQRIKSLLLIFVLCFGADCFTGNLPISGLLRILSSIAFFGIVLSIDLKEHAVYPEMRRLSTLLYLTHMYVWTFYYVLVYGQKTYGLDAFVVTTLVCLVLGLAYDRFARRRLLGQRR